MAINPTLFLGPLLFVINPDYVYKISSCFATKTDTYLPFCNRVGNVGAISKNDIIHIKNFFGEMPFRWFVESHDIHTIKLLEEHELIYKISFPAMHLNLKNLQPINYPEIAIHEINENNDIETWIDVVTQSYTTNRFEFTKFIHYQIAHAAPHTLRFYLAFYQDNPASACMTIQSNNVIALHWVGTLPAYRKKGLGYAITHKSLTEAKNYCTDAVLFASEMAKRMYERIGFKEYAQYKVYGK